MAKRCRKLYHVTPAANVDSIRRQGLVPKRGAWGQTYPTPRIYLSSDSTDLYAVAGQMIIDHGVDEAAVLVVDGCQVGPLRRDPDWRGERPTAFFTERAVPAAAVNRVVERYTRDDFDD